METLVASPYFCRRRWFTPGTGSPWRSSERDVAYLETPGMGIQPEDLQRLLAHDVGEDIFALAARIFPICRSITGEGVRRTLREIGSHLALRVHEIPTGTEVFDWTIPREWNIRDAYIK